MVRTTRNAVPQNVLPWSITLCQDVCSLERSFCLVIKKAEEDGQEVMDNISLRRADAAYNR